MFDLKSLLGGLPGILQYLAIFALVFLILFISVALTKLLSRHFDNSEKFYFNDPEAYDKTIPDPLRPIKPLFKRRPKKNATSEEKNNVPAPDSDRPADEEPKE